MSPIIELLFPNIKICQCVEEEPLLTSVTEIVKWCNEDINTRKPCSVAFNMTEFYIIASALTCLNYIDHGCTIKQSWLTQKGKNLLEQLTKQT